MTAQQVFFRRVVALFFLFWITACLAFALLTLNYWFLLSMESGIPVLLVSFVAVGPAAMLYAGTMAAACGWLLGKGNLSRRGFIVRLSFVGLCMGLTSVVTLSYWIENKTASNITDLFFQFGPAAALAGFLAAMIIGVRTSRRSQP